MPICHDEFMSYSWYYCLGPLLASNSSTDYSKQYELLGFKSSRRGVKCSQLSAGATRELITGDFASCEHQLQDDINFISSINLITRM